MRKRNRKRKDFTQSLHAKVFTQRRKACLKTPVPVSLSACSCFCFSFCLFLFLFLFLPLPVSVSLLRSYRLKYCIYHLVIAWSVQGFGKNQDSPGLNGPVDQHLISIGRIDHHRYAVIAFG